MTLVYRRPPNKATRTRIAPRRVSTPRARGVCPVSESETEAALADRWSALLSCKGEGDIMGVAACYLDIGDLLLGRGQTEQAGEMYRLSLEASRRATLSPQG